jgi:hypothetical protein
MVCWLDRYLGVFKDAVVAADFYRMKRGIDHERRLDKNLTAEGPRLLVLHPHLHVKTQTNLSQCEG